MDKYVPLKFLASNICVQNFANHLGFFNELINELKFIVLQLLSSNTGLGKSPKLIR